MPLYDYDCGACGQRVERVSTIAARHAQDCDRCGARMVKLVAAPLAVHDDTILGGFDQENFGAEVEHFTSKRAMARRAKELGLEPFVRHQPLPGTDKSDQTSRWV